MGRRGASGNPLTVKRWRRYGKDRLYVNLADGGRVGWLDLQTGGTTLEREDLRAEFEDALRTFVPEEVSPARARPSEGTQALPARESSSPQSATDPTAAVVRSPTAVEPFAVTIDWRDVGTRGAGEAAKEQAEAHRKAAPVRTFAARVLGVHTDERAWRIGATGERRVAAQLEKLPDAWRVLHAIPVGDRGADIDHLVIGPGGVFTVNAKHHPDANVWVGGNTVMVNGHRQPYVRNSRHEARRATRLLSAATGSKVEALGVIAIVGAHKGFTIKAQPSDVRVIARKGLVSFLTSMPSVLRGGGIDSIYRAARRSDTWQ